MAIPKEILNVERPVNTIVYAYGKNKDRYAVKERIGCKYNKGRRIPITGNTIGHIIDGKYVELNHLEPTKVSLTNTDLKDWGNVVLCDIVFKSILSELKNIYCEDDALKIYCIAIIRVCNPGIKDYELKEAYDTSFLSELYPNIALSKNTVSVFFNNLGKACSKIRKFMQNRAATVKIDHHLLIDGTLKSNNSKINSLSDFSRKSKTKGSRDISVLFAFDLEIMEPICSKCFPGNMLDNTAYEEFISENKITKGIVVADKGFPSSVAETQFFSNPDLHYLNPIKRNSKLIDTHKLRDYTGILTGYDNVTFKKAQCTGKNKWLYSYRDAKRAAVEEQDWLKRTKTKNDYSFEILQKKQKVFGTVVLESDIDISPETAYKAYESRWEIEIVMRFYKSACEFDETRVQNDYSVIATEFCDFLATVLTYRLINKFDSKNLFDKMTYKKIMKILDRAKKVKTDNEEWNLIKMNPSQIEILQKLELLPVIEHAQKKRGRPKKTNV